MQFDTATVHRQPHLAVWCEAQGAGGALGDGCWAGGGLPRRRLEGVAGQHVFVLVECSPYAQALEHLALRKGGKRRAREVQRPEG